MPLMKKDNFVKNLDLLTGDTRAACEALAAAAPSAADPDWRVTDPFESFYEIVYQLTMRTVGADDIASDPKLLKSTLSIFDWFEKSDSFAKVIFPWLPTVNHYLRLYYGAKLAFVFRDIIERRKKTGIKGNDALQFLIDRDLSLANIVAVCFPPPPLWTNFCPVLSCLVLSQLWPSGARPDGVCSSANK